MFTLFERLVPPFPQDEPATPPHGLAAFVWHYTKDAWPMFAFMAAVTTILSIVEVSVFGFLGEIVDWLSGVSKETFLAEQGWMLALMGLTVLAVIPMLVFLQSLITFQGLAGNFPMRFRWSVHRWLLGQSMSFFQDEFAGRISTKLMQTALALRESVVKMIDTLLYVAVYFTGVMLLVASADWQLVIPFVGWLALYTLMLRYFIPRLQAVSETQADARAVMTGRVVDAYTNIATVKLFAHTLREADHARESMSGFLGTVYRQMRLINLFYLCLCLLNALLLFSVGALGISLWLGDLISVGAVAVSVALVLRLNGMSQWVMWEVAGLFENIGTLRDGMATFTTARAIADRPGARDLVVTEGRVEFQDVTFRYGEGDEVIDRFSLDIRPGEKIGLVGRSGAGKSTLLNLLLRFHDVEAGRILIDGQDISEVRQESLRENIGMVTQDTSLLHRSIRENILYGRPDASEEEVQQAIERAEAHRFVSGLMDVYGNRGLDAQVGERGVKLSGGQRQRIAIARVMLKDAPILLLDEATSALDSEVEAAIAENLFRLMAGKTVIAIAHRLSTIAALDRLIVLDEGRIIEQGSHAELIRANGLYAQLWERQSGGFLDAGLGPVGGRGLAIKAAE